MKRVVTRLMILWLGIGVGACGGSGGDDHDHPFPDGGGAPGAVIDTVEDAIVDTDDDTAWTELDEPVVSLQGGTAISPLGEGRDGGRVRMISGGAVRFDPAASLPDWPSVPPTPAGGRLVGTDDLRADVTHPGTIRVAGTAFTSGTDAVRTITATEGDLVIEGMLLAGDLGTSGQSLALHAPAGTVFVTGLILTTPVGALADGDHGGTLTISAQQIVISGRLLSRGKRNHAGAGGAGGAITLTASAGPVVSIDGRLDSSGGDGTTRGGDGGMITVGAPDAIVIAGTIDAAGGAAHGVDATTGGDSGELLIAGRGDLALLAAVDLRGGAATSGASDAAGGDASPLRIEVRGAAAVAGVVDARGGPAVAGAGGLSIGGAAGALLIGEVERPAEIRVLIPLLVDGGAGEAAGGGGGAIAVEPHGGDLVVASLIQMDGGASRLRPGRGGVLTGAIGSRAGGVRIAGAIVGRGGAATDASVAADGGNAGDLYLRVTTLTGDVVVETTGRIAMEGGASSGQGRAGDGGFIDIFTRDGDFSMAGQLFARGGDAPDPGGTGGNGGPLYVHTDTNADGFGGNITIEPDGLIDVSGGTGSTGGSARNNGRYGVEYFPQGRHQIAVLLNSDTAPGRLRDGVIQNLGMIIARGAATDGWGGDVVYHGRRAGHHGDPFPGQLFVEGHGAGQDGQYYMQ